MPLVLIEINGTQRCRVDTVTDPLTFTLDMEDPSDSEKKVSKYKYLEVKILELCHMRRSIISLVFGTLGLIRKGSGIHCSGPGSSRQEIQKCFLTSITHNLRKVLSI